MRFFTTLTDGIARILKWLAIIVILLLLIFIIKWKVDAVYYESISQENIHFGIVDGIKKTGNDIRYLISGDAEDAVQFDTVPEEEQVTINISEAMDVQAIADQLKDKGLIENSDVFKAMVNDMGLFNRFISGTYDIPKSSKALDTLLTLTGSTYREYDFEVKEGDNAASVAARLEEMGVISAAYAFVAQCEQLGVTNSFKPGQYTLSTPSKVVRIIEKLTQTTLEA
ncbi:hypothetical protein O6R05_06135 [Peptoniphilus equinus]|uniref:YceG-like family protein n=1 Tax=Peptoniphilus equinus TaxID=3016343 RepID=A0ABY7QUK3_9FIRM|nr:hypothetical protein [Peptoniphilus equinus]WBW49573.1 hypothetical protein O6R05_06135 [Peptoniphilus equinus]